MTQGIKKGKVYKLLNDSLLSYYWLGFILADGNFCNDNKRLRFRLGQNNQLSVKQLCKYLEKEYKSSNSCCFMSTDVVPKIAQLLGLSVNCKTYNPPELLAYDQMSDQQFVALMVGFIDGDGCIKYQTNRTTPILTVKLHSSWTPFLEYVHKRLFKIFQAESTGTVKINNTGYARMNIGHDHLLKQLKLFTIAHKLPVIPYKWDHIDLSYTPNCVVVEMRSVEAKKLRAKGFSVKEIAACLKVTYNKAYHALRRS
jgi:hypothetical protein